MNILETWGRVEELEDEISTIKEDIINIVRPIFKELGLTVWGKPSLISKSTKEELVIETEYWSSGGKCDFTYKIPLSVLNSPDPIQVAKEYFLAKEMREDEARKAQILAEIERLKKSLEQG